MVVVGDGEESRAVVDQAVETFLCRNAGLLRRAQQQSAGALSDEIRMGVQKPDFPTPLR